MRRLLLFLAAAALLCPVRAAAQRNQNVAKGFSADKVFEFNNVDHINTFNGSLNVVLPLGQKYQANGSLSYQFALTYSGNNWETVDSVETEYDAEGAPHEVFTNYTYPVGSWDKFPSHSAGLGWRLSFGEISAVETGPSNDTANWFYRGPDGSEHRFHRRLHHDEIGVANPPADPDPGVYYTNDGSYLRSRRYVDGVVAVVDVEFPDGSVHQFDESSGAIRHMRDAYNNRVTFNETTSGTTKTLTIADGFRTHTMTFERVVAMTPPGTDDPTTFDLLRTLDVAAFNGHAYYRFYYRDNDLSVVSRQVGMHQDCGVAPATQVPVLDHVALDSGPNTAIQTLYRFAYDLGDNFWDPAVANGTTYSDATLTPGQLFTICGRQARYGFSGNLTSLTLPTLGKISWKYVQYKYPASSINSCTGATGVPSPCGGSATVHAVGVKERIETDAAGRFLSKRVYTSELFAAGPIKTASHTLLTTIDTYTGMAVADPEHQIPENPGTVFSKQLSFYSAGAVDNTTTGTKAGEYGVPFTRRATNPTDTRGITNPDPLNANRFLSTAIADGNGTIQRVTYVGYDADDANMTARDQSNRRVRSERTVYLDDGSKYTTSDSSDYDGLGHYRTATTGGNFPGVNVRTTTTAYNRRDSAVDTTA
ncbi:MAG TPA: hypothetical protein VN181_14185 [Thermoanaerobaculia bacterium]|nr:hypothetical protein [Thermoanaerobaculia bacterium]